MRLLQGSALRNDGNYVIASNAKQSRSLVGLLRRFTSRNDGNYVIAAGSSHASECQGTRNS